MKLSRFLQGVIIGMVLVAGLYYVSPAYGQTYPDHLSCKDTPYGWAVTTQQHVLRYYSAIDVNGECEWHLYTIVNGGWTWDKVARRAASVTSAGGLIVFVPGTVAPPIPPPPPITPPSSTAVHMSVTVVPMRYSTPPSTNQAAIDAYNATIPAVTQANVQAMMDQIKAWYAKETYGVLQLDVTVAPDRPLAGNPVCNWGQVWGAIGGTGSIKVGVLPYSCWQSHGVGTNGLAITWGNSTVAGVLDPGELAHEIGHALGMLHSGSKIPPATSVTEYGNFVDLMGRGGSYTGLTHLLAAHKAFLGALSPAPCASATLRSIYDFPDALKCGSYYVEYLADWQEVWITQGGYVATDDNTLVARLRAGQSWTDGTRTIKHIVTGQVQVTP